MKTDSKSVLKFGSIPLIDPELLSEIISTAADITLLISATGDVVSVLVNPHHRSFGQLGHWEGKPVNQVLTTESHAKLELRLGQMKRAGAKTQAIELNHADQVNWEFPVRYSMHRVAPDDSVLMLGRDLRPIAEMQQHLVLAQLALERDYEAQRELDTRYRVLMEATRDAVVLVSMNNGRISDLNAAAAAMLGGSRQELIGGAVAQEFEGRRRGEFLESLTTLAATDSLTPVELQARRSQKRLRVVPILFRAAGERLLLCRLEHTDEHQVASDDLTERLTRLYNEGVDAILFTDDDGLIVAANEAFLKLTDSANLSALRGRTLSDFLSRGTVDLKVLLDNARRARQLRMYSTKILTEFAGQVPVEISVTYLNERPKPGFVLVMRDSSRADALRRPGVSSADDGMRSVMELVGSSTLKDIVAETADVVEKMCIQTAIELTRNNRVAAAEMLGLSRQSLYVKLRKFGLLSKDGD